MKKRTLIMSALVLLSLGITACNNTPSGSASSNPATSGDDSSTTSQHEDHVHSWSVNWSNDETHHWHPCRGFVDGVKCTEKGSYAEHTWDAGVIITRPRQFTPGSAKYTCTVCNREKVEELPPTGVEDQVGFTFYDSELNTAQEIHTTQQKNYLDFTGDYYNITASQLSSYGANGNSDNSAPQSVTVKWDFEAPTGKTVKNFSFAYSQNADMSDAYTISGLSSSANKVSFYNAYLGDNYFEVTATFTDNSTLASDVKVFKVTTQAPRNLKVGNMPNCRDMGGRTTYAGGKIRQGLIYRTAGNKFDNSSPINDECRNVLLNQLKVKTEINVANGDSNTVNLGNGVTVKNCYMDYGASKSDQGVGGNGVPFSNMSRNAEKLRMVLDILKDRNNYPAFYHCRIGTDRTGIVGITLNGLLGVPFNEAIQDYCMSNFAPINGQRYPHKHASSTDSNGDDPAKYIDELLAMPGKNFQEKTINALLSIGVPMSTINSIIDIMTIGNKAELPDTAKVGIGNDLSSTGSRKTGSNFNDPEVYYQISSNGTVSYTATTTAGQKNVVVYLGSTNYSNQTKLADCISLKIDGTEQSIVDKTMFKAGFGTTDQNHRTAYMFQILGKYNLSAGSHTFTITSKNGSFNVATISVFDAVATESL